MPRIASSAHGAALLFCPRLTAMNTEPCAKCGDPTRWQYRLMCDGLHRFSWLCSLGSHWTPLCDGEVTRMVMVERRPAGMVFA